MEEAWWIVPVSSRCGYL